MSNKILDSLDYFSNITQRTLSAFHLNDNEGDIYNDVEEIKRLLNNSRIRKLITAEENEDGSFTRYFNDGFTDIVSFSDLRIPSYYGVNKEYEHIQEALSNDCTPIVSIKLDKKIKLVENKLIEKPSEIMFFI